MLSDKLQLSGTGREQTEAEVLAMHRILDVVVLTLFLRHFSKAAREGQKDNWSSDNWSFDNWTRDNWASRQLVFWTTGLIDNWTFRQLVF